jgi:PRTRC genetic system ThiF family protein
VVIVAGERLKQIARPAPNVLSRRGQTIERGRMKKQKPQQPDLSFARAANLMLARRDETRISLVGCGGTGGWLAPAVARLAYVLKEQGRDVKIAFYDPDHVEEKNIPRQNFCTAEIGRNKAITLAARYGAAWGLEIAAIPHRFDPAKPAFHSYSALHIICGCVDNAAGRKVIAETLKKNRAGEAPGVWWLDSGNSKESGQVILGSASTPAMLKGCFQTEKICAALPSPFLVEPSLMNALPEESSAKKMNCAEMMIANMQSLEVNQQVAAIAAGYLTRMLTGAPLKRFATYFDLPTGSTVSKAITPENIFAGCGEKRRA